MLLFVGRIQPLKAPDVLLRAAAALLDARPGAARRGWSSPSSAARPAPGWSTPRRWPQLAAELGIADVVRFVPPVPQAELADWYRAADLVAVPSYNESFGLVAIEAQACGTPVVAAAVGGLPTAVARRRVRRCCVDGHDPRDWADALRRPARRPGLRARAGAGARSSTPAGSRWDRDRRAACSRSTARRARRDARPRSRRPWPGGRTPPPTVRATTSADDELEFEEPPPGVFVVALPGEKKLQDDGPPRRRRARARRWTRSSCRHPDENHEGVYRWLLERNPRMYAVAFAVDRLGDIYLDGRLPLHAVTPDELDRLLGAVLDAADESFNTILELGFATAIRKEWAWRNCAASRPPTSRRSAAGWRGAGPAGLTVSRVGQRAAPSGRPGREAGPGARLAARHGDADQRERAPDVRHRRRRLAEEQPRPSRS